MLIYVQLQDATQCSVQACCDRVVNTIQDADAEIARMRRILAEIDTLEAEFDKIKHIRDVVKCLRERVDEASSRLDRVATLRGRSNGIGGAQRRRKDNHGVDNRSCPSPSSPPLGRSPQTVQPPLSPPVGSLLQPMQHSTHTPVDPSPHLPQPMDPESEVSSSHSDQFPTSPAGTSSSSDDKSSAATSLQQFMELDEDDQRVVDSRLILRGARDADSTDQDRDADQHLREQHRESRPIEATLAPSPPQSYINVVSQSNLTDEIPSPTFEIGSPCPSLSTHSEVGSDSGQLVTGDEYGSFSSDVANQLSSLVRNLVSYWFYHVWPISGDSATNAFRSCTQGAEGTSTGNDTRHGEDGPSPAQTRTSRVTKRSRQETDDEDSGNPGKRKTRPTRHSSGDDVKLLACPFSKYDPLRYSNVNINEKEYRGCSTPCLVDISRLKYGALPLRVLGLLYFGC